jgi:hypothetical protein
MEAKKTEEGMATPAPEPETSLAAVANLPEADILTPVTTSDILKLLFTSQVQ